MKRDSQHAFLNRFWSRFGAFIAAWMLVGAGGYWANDPYHNDEGSAAWLFLGLLGLPCGTLLWLLGDQFVFSRICKNPICKFILIFLTAAILYSLLSFAMLAKIKTDRKSMEGNNVTHSN